MKYLEFEHLIGLSFLKFRAKKTPGVSMRNISEETENECYLPFLKMQLQNTLVSR